MSADFQTRSTLESRFPKPELTDLPEDLRTRILTVQEKAGFVPEVFLIMARRPDEFRAFFAYHDAVMERTDSALSQGEREMIVTATSALNSCLYCVVAHGAVLRIRERDPLIADQIAINYRKAPITERQRAMLDFALKVAGPESHTIEQADFTALEDHGFNAEDAWDIAAITGFYGLSNRIANVVGMMPNPEFYTMGR
ncbi:MAG: alkylhydroperoxidase [Rhodospirillaceae bacterium]|nr:MAG: alkylhydroperoxidase [Rhodospirillaceae bacterium]